jgi:hypothetical protein
VRLIDLLDKVDLNWRESVSSNPLEAAVELCIIEPEELEEYQALNFHGGRYYPAGGLDR